MINKELLKKHFSKNAVNYDNYAVVQKRMANELIKIINPYKNNFSDRLKILEVGCGTGYLTRSIINAFPNARITAVDIASGMIDICRKNIVKENVDFLCEDIEEVTLNDEFDIIVSNATFQWLNNFEKTLKKLCSLLKKDGIICFSTFGSNTFNELHISYNKAKEKLKIANDTKPGQTFYNLEDLSDLCISSLGHKGILNFTIKTKEFNQIEYFKSVKEFLCSVKKIGANNSNKNQNSKSPLIVKEMMKIYDRCFRNDKNMVKATYHCMFLTIEKNIKVLREIV